MGNPVKTRSGPATVKSASEVLIEPDYQPWKDVHQARA